MPRLPAEYQEVEYIQSSGTQYINTLYNPDQNTIIEAKINVVSYNSSQNYDKIYGVTNGMSGSSGRAFFMQSNRPSNNKLRALNYSNEEGYRNYYVDSTAAISLGTDYTIKHTNTQFWLNGTSQGTCSATTYSISYPIYLFVLNVGGTPNDQLSNVKLYWFKIYNGTTLVRKFIPCYRKQDGVIGLYDMVNNQFYTNSGTGSFTKGADKDKVVKISKVYVWKRIPRLPNEYQEVEWIGASGSQYINTGYVVNTNTSRIYTKFEPQNVSTSQGSSTYQNPLFGTRTSDYNYETCLWASPSNQTYSVGLSLNGCTQEQATPANSFPKYPLGTIIELDYGKTGGTYNSFTFTWNAQYQGVTPNLLIFGIWSQGSVDARKFFGKLYSFKIYEGDNEKRNFVPCYRKSDNVIGMYDLVNNQFYINSGSGTFTKGSDVTEGVDNTVYKEFLVRPKEEEERVIFDYDFKTTNPGNDLVGYNASYGFTQISGSGLRTYNVSSNDKRGRAAKQIGEDITNKTIIMDGTWYAQFGNTRTGFGMGLRTGPATTTNDNASGIYVHLGTTYYSSFTTYDGLSCPGISSGTGKGVSAFGRTIGTSGNYTVRFIRTLNLKEGTSNLEVYRNGSLFSTQDYTLSSSDLALAKGYAASNCYYTAAFERGYSDVPMFMTNWKITIKG